jgi:hypothetical protein
VKRAATLLPTSHADGTAKCLPPIPHTEEAASLLPTYVSLSHEEVATLLLIFHADANIHQPSTSIISFNQDNYLKNRCLSKQMCQR